MGSSPHPFPVIGWEGPGVEGETEGAKACHALLADPVIAKMTYDGRTDLTILQRHGFAVS